jgi:threonine/homoserine/homoserine lactone efflux protein
MPSAIWQPILTLLLASAVIMGSPGPSTISVTAVGAAYGFRRAIPYAIGLILGTTTVLLAVAAGVVAVIAAIPHGTPILLGLAAVYSLYLASRIATAPPLAARDATVAAPALAGGYLLAIANPKAYLAIAAVFAGTILTADPTRDALAKLVLLTFMIVLIHLAWLLAGTSLARLLHHPVASRIINVTLAIALVGTTAMAVLH